MTTKRQKQPTKNATKKPIKLGEKQAPFNTLAQPVNNCFKDAIQVPEKQGTYIFFSDLATLLNYCRWCLSIITA
jgi:hypothetical protein